MSTSTYVVHLRSGEKATHEGYLFIVGGALAFSHEPDGLWYAGYAADAWDTFERM